MSLKLAAVEVVVGTDSNECAGIEPGGDAGPGEGEEPALVDAATLLG